ncbi:DNA replication/repair protein RecF [Patescibacteria group bacterium]|nr:DNA replication/repair protein RecF [Patescibacteria group bacterium]MBU1683657.1 DNA replication/repair protein RecF [Patescibacteria group bacterium]MBU1934795.1 DNA replication/repair protein RecF [Patescibacteria group bacterium]
MKISHIKIKGFRNLQPLELKIDKEKSVFAFVGANGHGKTNLLEAIYLCALSKSFRTRTNMDLIGFEEDFCALECSVDREDAKIVEVIVIREPAQKVLKINGVKKSASDFIGVLKAVFFSPDDLSEMAFAPRLRRRYLDVLLSQLNHEYLDKLMRYQEAIKNRNALLKKIREKTANKDELDFWDNQIVDFGLYITQKRADLIVQLQTLLKDLYKSISQTEDVLEIHYQSNIGDIEDEQDLLLKITENIDRDIAGGSTQLGPHRDDLQFLINGHDMVYFASRGEWRSLVLALKFAEIKLIEDKTGERPVLLLDDVFSELDEVRQKYLFKAILGTQTFITTTHKEFLDGLKVEKQVYEVKDGEIK